MDKEVHWAFESLKAHLAFAPAWGFQTYQSSLIYTFRKGREGIAPGVLTQMLSDIPHRILIREIEAHCPGWPACLRAVAATCELLQKTENVSLGQPITIYAPHQVLNLLKQKRKFVVIAGRMSRCQAILLYKSQHLPQNCK